MHSNKHIDLLFDLKISFDSVNIKVSAGFKITNNL